MTTVLIRYYSASYQYREPAMDHFFDQQDFDRIKQLVEATLTADKMMSNVRTEVFWATFNVWDSEKQRWDETPEMFTHRIKVN